MEDWGPPRFRFRIMWLKEKSFDALIQKWWKEMSVSGWIMDGFLVSSKIETFEETT